MQSYLQSILPRLQQYSKQLNDEANFVEIPWAYMDESGVKVTYLFRRNNELLVTRQGEVATGKWEYLPAMQSLLIEYGGKRRMYNQGFLDKAVLLLRKEGTQALLALANTGLLPGLDIADYLRTKQNTESKSKKEKLTSSKELPYYPITLTNGKVIHVWKTGDSSGNVFEKGAKVTYANTNKPLHSGFFRIDGGGKLWIQDGSIAGIQGSSIKGFIILLIVFVILIAFIAISSY